MHHSTPLRRRDCLRGALDLCSVDGADQLGVTVRGLSCRGRYRDRHAAAVLAAAFAFIAGADRNLVRSTLALVAIATIDHSPRAPAQPRIFVDPLAELALEDHDRVTHERFGLGLDLERHPPRCGST